MQTAKVNAVKVLDDILSRRGLIFPFDEFTEFRKKNANAQIILDGFDATKKHLNSFDFQGMDLTGVLNLEKANALDRANLKGATLSNAQLIGFLNEEGVSTFNHYREHNPHAQIDLSGFDATDKYLYHCNFVKLDLTGVLHLEKARYHGDANYRDAKLSNAQLIGFLNKEGVSTFNRYRMHNPKAQIDLSGFDATGKDLDLHAFENLDLTGVLHLEKAHNLQKANLKGVKLSNAQLIGFLNEELVSFFNHYRRQNPDTQIDLSGFDATGKKLADFNLSRLDLTGIQHLDKALYLNKANLDQATITTNQRDALQKADPKLDLSGTHVVEPPIKLVDELRGIREQRTKIIAREITRRTLGSLRQPTDTPSGWER